jgi:hypothetical protein
VQSEVAVIDESRHVFVRFKDARCCAEVRPSSFGARFERLALFRGFAFKILNSARAESRTRLLDYTEKTTKLGGNGFRIPGDVLKLNLVYIL